MADEQEVSSNGFDPESALKFVRRIENIQIEIDEIMTEAAERAQPLREDIAAVKREAQDAGVGKKELGAIIRKRRLEYKAAHAGDSLDLAQRANFEAMIESLERLAEEIGPLGEAARDRARAGAAG